MIRGAWLLLGQPLFSTGRRGRRDIASGRAREGDGQGDQPEQGDQPKEGENKPEERDGSQDKKLTDGEIKKLKDAGENPEQINALIEQFVRAL